MNRSGIMIDMDPIDDQMITPADFPELKLLAWNRDPARPMPPEEVFALYERNWRFVDRDALTQPERQLIEQLAERFGHGRLLIA